MIFNPPEGATLRATAIIDGPPVGFTRMLSGVRRPDAVKYKAFKELVLISFLQQIGKQPYEVIDIDRKFYIVVVAYYKNDVRPDTDNVEKGVTDALFSGEMPWPGARSGRRPVHDKNVAGTFDFFFDKDNPRVEVELWQ